MNAKATAVAGLAVLGIITTVTSTIDRAQAKPLSYPTDLRQHADYTREWWSISGRAATRAGRQFRWQASFFRFALADTEQLYTAEFSILDVRSGKLESRQRSVRALFPNAGRSRAIAVDDWDLSTPTARDPSRERIDLDLGSSSAGLSLRLLAQKPPVPSLAFHGYSVTRLTAAGRLRIAGATYLVRGLAWLDHEYETTPAAAQRVGWERFELQLDDGRDIELFSSRLRDGKYRLSSQRSDAPELGAQQTIVGSREPMDGLSIDLSGLSHRLSPESIELIVRGNTRWHSPHDEAVYPALWQLTVGREATVAVVPTARDQEILPTPRGVAVWYGAVDLAQADPPGLPVGTGFVELSGYATPTSL